MTESHESGRDLPHEAAPAAAAERLWLAAVLAGFVLAAVYVNPWRETATSDDWAYALTCWHFADTGRYVPHDWIAANMPFQAWWGALFVKVLGKSFGALRLSTLAMAVIGLLAFHGLARELGTSAKRSAWLVLGLSASPLCVRLSFTFMTNIHFLSLVLAAMFLFARGLRRDSAAAVFAGSLAAAAAILVRQFGVGLIPALLGVWILGERRAQRLPIVLLGCLAPLCAGAWQAWMGLRHPWWGATYSMTIQSFYMGERGLVLANAVVRVALALQYMALFALPFVLAAGGSLVRGQSRVRRAMAVASVAICLSIVALWQHLRGGSPWMPYLPWNFDAVTRWPAAARAAITVLASIGAVALARIFWLRWFGAGGWRAMSPAARFVDLASLFVMSLHMVLYQLGDEYLLVLLPLTLMALARHIPTQRTWSVRLAAAGCVVVWGLSAEWTRASLAAGEAQWQAAEGLCQAGIPRKQVCGPWTWVAYDRFDDYLQRINRRPVRDLKSFWVQWLPDQLARARFCVTAAPEGPPEGIWIVRRRIPYAGPWFGEAFVYVFERRGNAAAD